MLPFSLRSNKIQSIEFRNVFSRSNSYVVKIEYSKESQISDRPIPIVI